MLQKLHQKLGTAGFVISIIALVAALGGGAYAASGGLSGKQKKEVKKIAQTEAKKFATAGPQGPAGAAGAPGAKGDAGAKGDNGANGTDGAAGTGATTESFTGNKKVGSTTCAAGGVVVKSAGADTAVCNGAVGPKGPSGFGEVLPGGKTISGAFSYTALAETETFVRVPISFPIPVAERLDENHVHIINPAGEELNIHPVFPEPEEEGEEVEAPPKTIPDPTDCLGSPEEPSAEPGHLCVYVASIESIQFGFGPWSTVPVIDPSYPAEEALLKGTGTTGALLILGQGSPGGFAAGTWALTAPAD